jgi:hypothetical protein
MKSPNKDCEFSWLATSIKMALLTLLITPTAEARIKFNYGIPEGFSADDMDNQARYIINFHGRMLPDFTYYSGQEKAFSFNEEKYQQAGLTHDEISLLKKVLNSFDISECVGGCDKNIADQHVTLDKTQRTINIRSQNDDYLVPVTRFGLVHNQNVDIRGSSDDYRAANVNGSAWLGLPAQMFGYLNWYANYNKNGETSTHNSDISSYYLQKNFQSTYLRAGKQNSLDYSSGAVSTVLAPSYGRFVTFGSQGHLREGRPGQALPIYAAQDGNFEIYRDGRLLLKRPASIGRNELDLNDLPGGYYTVEIRLVDRAGHILRSETQQISNVNFNGYQEETVWHVTWGKDLGRDDDLLEGALSKNLGWFFMNGEGLKGTRGRWASEVNASRPTQVAGVSVDPSLGVMSGEKSSGGYASLTLSSPALGQMSASHYLKNDVSYYYRSRASTSFYYSHSLGKALISYNYAKYSGSATHQVESRWSFNPGSAFVSLSVGVQKGGFMASEKNYGVYLNTTLTFADSQASFNSAVADGRTQLSGDVKHGWQDDFGTSTLGISASHADGHNSFNTYASRAGTRGDFSANVGRFSNTTDLDLNYRGMVAMNSQGISLGRYSYSGAALMVDTPDIPDLDYGFQVEGAHVAGNGTYAVPVAAYENISFARVRTDHPGWDMDVEIPAYVTKAHPGQVYHAKAKVAISAQYSGFLRDVNGKPVSGFICEVKDNAFKNGLFSFTSPRPLKFITVQRDDIKWRCDMTAAKDSVYTCKRG